MPLAAYGPSFNFSIWHIVLAGNNDPIIVETAALERQITLDTAAWRLCLRFLRKRGQNRAFAALKDETNVELENPLITKLFEVLVSKKSFQNQDYAGQLEECESLIQSSYCNGKLFEEYIEERVPYVAHWTRLDTLPKNNQNDTDGLKESSESMMIDSDPTILLPRDNNGQRISFNEEIETFNNRRTPAARGGHQMIWDPIDNKVYLFGGWDGFRDLGDLWSYDPSINFWTCLSDDVRHENGPCPRSCHKLVLHASRRRIYVLGRYVDVEGRGSNVSRQQVQLQSDFYYYNIPTNGWVLVSEDTALEPNGPPLVYDHQMTVDEDSDVIYVFGGRQLGSDGGNVHFGGLHSYHIETNQWRLIRVDEHFNSTATVDEVSSMQKKQESKSEDESIPITPLIRSRIGHAMIFNPPTKELIIYAGQRQKEHLCDMYRYHIPSNRVTSLTKDTSRFGGPDAGFTQRVTLDVSTQEMFLFSGLMREKKISSPVNSSTTSPNEAPNVVDSAKNSFWMYSLKTGKWSSLFSTSNTTKNIDDNKQTSQNSTIYLNNITNGAFYNIQSIGCQGKKIISNTDDSDENMKNQESEPAPRFAHQLVYDMQTKTHYLFGGNPGVRNSPTQRLGDFWRLLIRRNISPEDVLRRVSFLIRRQRFHEMCILRQSTVAPCSIKDAMQYLQTHVSKVVNHLDSDEGDQFRVLAAKLLSPEVASSSKEMAAESISNKIEKSRLDLFNQIVTYLPRSMRPPPSQDLCDLIDPAALY